MRRLILFVAVLAGCGDRPPAACSGLCTPPHLSTLALVAGQPGGNGWVDGAGSAAHFADPWMVTGDGAGHLYVIDGSIVRAVDTATAAVSTLAGTFGVVGGVDGVGPAAQFFQPNGVAVAAGTVYLADTENHTIRTIDVQSGAVTAWAGALGVAGTDDGPLAAARFREPEGLALDGSGNLYVADTDNDTIRKIVIATGTVSTLAGAVGVAGTTDGVGSAARFNKPRALAWDGGGTLYVVDSLNASIREVALADGTVTTRATLPSTPAGVAAVGGDVLASLADHRIVRIDAAGTVTTVAGAAGASGFADGSGAEARFFRPAGLVVDGDRVYVCDDGNYVLRLLTLSTGAVTTVAGAWPTGTSDGTGSAARFFAPQAIAVDGAGSAAYVADTNNQTVRKLVLATGEVTTLAGAAGQAMYADGAAGDARFNTPSGIAWDDAARRLYVADTANRSIRVVDAATGAVSTLPTNGAPGAGFARFNAPTGLALAGGHLYVSDAQDHVVDGVDLATNLVTIVAGSPRVAGASDGVGKLARFNAPAGLASDGKGALYVADVLNSAVRKVELASGTVTTVAGVIGVQGSDDGAATTAHLAYPLGVTVDALGDLFVADSLNALVRRVDLKASTMTTVIGVPKLAGVRLGPLPAQLGSPTAVALAPDGSLLVVSESAVLVAH